MKITDKRPYVYTYAYPDRTVFYVGVGTGDRINRHETEARNGKTTNPHKVLAIRKVWKEGGQVIKHVLAYFENREDAYMYEIALIFFLPNLTNVTSGGTGVQSEEAKRRGGISRIGQKRPLTAIKSQREKMLDYRHTQEAIDKIASSKLGKHRTPVTIEKMRQASMGNTNRKGKPLTPIALAHHREVHSVNLRPGYRHSSTTIQKLKDTALSKNQDRIQAILDVLRVTPYASITEIKSVTGIPSTCISRLRRYIREQGIL